MPNWDNDEGPGFNDFDDVPERTREDIKRNARRSIMRTPEQRVLKTWNGNPVKTMESDHVMNAILFCEKKFAEAKRNFIECYGEGNTFYFDSVFDMFPEFANLRDEWFSRIKE